MVPLDQVTESLTIREAEEVLSLDDALEKLKV
jgi:hypothetical protein